MDKQYPHRLKAKSYTDAQWEQDHDSYHRAKHRAFCKVLNGNTIATQVKCRIYIYEGCESDTSIY